MQPVHSIIFGGGENVSYFICDAKGAYGTPRFVFSNIMHR